MSVLVLGATGTTGARIVQRLREREVPVVGAARAGSDRVFDWSDPSTHDAALTGIERIYVLPPPGDAAPEERTLPFLERARAAGARRFVLLGSSAIPEGAPGLGRIDGWLRRNAPEWTVLRPSWFMDNFVDPRRQQRQSIEREGRIVSATRHGRVGFVAADDIAEVAAAVLTKGPQNTAPILTGPAALSYDEVAAHLGVRHDSLTVDELAQRFTTMGIPARYAKVLASLDEAIANGAEDRVTDDVLRLTGRPPMAFADFLERQSSPRP